MIRILILFPLLDWLRINYGINTLVGILFSAILTYVLSERFVFRS